MRPTQRFRAAAGVSALLLAAVVGIGLLPSAQAAPVTISLSFQPPSPSNAAAAPGDTIVFSNGDRVAHTVKSKTGRWTFSKSIAAGATYPVKLPTTAGTFTYTDTHNIPIFGTTVDSGTVTSTAPKPSPSATTSPRPAGSATPKPSSKPVVTPKVSASALPPPTAAGTPSPGSGTALAPGLGTGILMTGTPSPGTGPQPDIAPPLPNTTANPAAGTTGTPLVNYADRPLTQGSTHRYGLPALLAVLALTGVGSLLVRFLLAQASPQPPKD